MSSTEEQALDCLLVEELQRTSLSEDKVVFPSGAAFPRELLLAVGGVKTTRLDVLVVFAKHTSARSWSVDRVAYVKDARESGVTTADLTDRAKLLAFLKSGSEERQAKRPRVAENASFGSDGLLDGPPGVVLHGCRSLSDRNSILLSKTKNFAPVLEMLQSALRGQLSRPRDGKPSMAAAPVVKSSRYKEVQEQRFWQERLGTRDVDELGIDTNASFLADAAPQPMPAIALPPPLPVAPAAPVPRPPSAPHVSAPRPAVKEKTGGVPIIIVPSGLGAQVLVNMYNARDFLEGSTYVPWEERKNAGIAKEGMIEIRRRFGRAKPVVYQVTDKPPPKKSPDWARVAAVLVQGSAWQLKEFPFKGAAEGNLVETFANISAFYVRFDSEPSPEFVKKWSVHSLVLAKNTRFGDRGVLESLWTALDTHLSSRRSLLNW